MSKQEVLVHTRIIRILHWLIAAGLVSLLMSGLYIHNPVITAPYITMTTAHYMQFGVAFIVTGLVFFRVYYGIVTKDYKNILFRLSDARQFIELMKYYFFLRKQEPPHEKYNAGQKLIFTSWLVVFAFQFITGMLLYFPSWTNNYPILGNLQTIRFYHYLAALWYLGTLPVHVYLVLTGDPGRLQAIFTGWARLAKPKKTS